VLDIVLGKRLPLERDKKAHQADESDSEISSSDNEYSSELSLSSVESFQEAEFRLSSAVTRLDSLYKLASRIRNPRNRQQLSTRDLYKHIPESQRTEHIQNQEHFQVSKAAYIQRQQLLEWVDSEQLQKLGINREDLIAQYASAGHWLITRAGMANARRKQQFIYWKKHARTLGRDVTEETPATAKLPIDGVELHLPTVAHKQTSTRAPSKSMATSVTKMDLGMIGPEDMRSTISHRSYVSIVASPRGEDLTWPPAPSHLAGQKYFTCPYCGILCPERYLGRDDWRVHQIHDLQPYHCTYEDCSDPDRLYGVKQEWIDHENQHRRVWHCHSHEVEFETQSEYLQHLEEQHPENDREDYTPEIIAAVVGASSKPHRDCPFCPTTFSDVMMMQNHVRYHLERLALCILADSMEDEEDELASQRSSDSHQVMENRGRQDSIGKDFAEESQVFLTTFSEHDSDRDRLTEDGNLLSKANLQLNQPSSPVSWLETCLDRSIELHEPELTSMAKLASTYWDQGRWEEAEELEVQIMETSKAKLGADHPDTLASMANLASTYRDHGRWEKAKKLEVQVMETSKAKLGADHPSTLASMANLASIYRAQGRWKEAEKLEVQVMETSKAKLGVDHPDTLASMASLASIYRDQGRWEEAEAMYERAVQGKEKVLGPEHPSTLDTVNYLANFYLNQGRLNEAEVMYERALQGREKVLGPEHPSTLNTINNLANLYKSQGQLKEAETMYGRVLQGREKVLGPEHPSMLNTINDLANLYKSQGRLNEAEEMYKRALQGKEKAWGLEHPSTLDTIKRLANLYKSQGRLKEAETMYGRVLAR
jgi:tetratricopeptide (TPR) repeat protein